MVDRCQQPLGFARIHWSAAQRGIQLCSKPVQVSIVPLDLGDPLRADAELLELYEASLNSASVRAVAGPESRLCLHSRSSHTEWAPR